MRYAWIALLLLTAPALAAPQSYTLPEETAALLPGPNLDVVQQNCAACHSADYISTQPRSLKDPHAFWQGEVVKMKAVYGAPLEQADIPKIVDYLTQTYGQ